jgi:hypothetical protein
MLGKQVLPEATGVVTQYQHIGFIPAGKPFFDMAIGFGIEGDVFIDYY